MKKVKVFTLAILMGCGAVFAQNSIRITVGGAVPLGNFGEVKIVKDDIAKWALNPGDFSQKGGAGLGATLGLQGKIGIPSVSGLGVTLSMDFFYNNLNSDLKEYFDDIIDENENNIDCDDFTIINQKYINFAPMIGMNYEHPINDNFKLFVGFGVGPNFRKITNYSTLYDWHETNVISGEKIYHTDEYKEEYDMNVTYAYKLGIGTVIGKRFVISLDYFGLGTAKAKGDYQSDTYNTLTGKMETESDNFKYGKITPRILTLSMGVKF